MSTVGEPETVSALIISVSEGGEVRFLWNDDLAPLLELGEGRIVRASHVEPEGPGWSADLSPVEGPILGPFPLRQGAIDAERNWLEKNEFGKTTQQSEERSEQTDHNRRMGKETR